jgi:hypothetical protein
MFEMVIPGGDFADLNGGLRFEGENGEVAFVDFMGERRDPTGPVEDGLGFGVGVELEHLLKKSVSVGEFAEVNAEFFPR